MTDNRPRCSRRRALLGGATMAATLSGTTAGCLSLLPPVGKQVRYGRVDVPSVTDAEPQYRKWLPAQTEVPDVGGEMDVGQVHMQSATPGNLGTDVLGASFGIARDITLARLDYVGYDLEHYDYLHGVGSFGVVAEGDVERAVVTETLLEGGYSRDGTYHGWDVFDRTDIPRRVAVSDSAIVMNRGEDRRPLLKTLLDAGDGRIERYHEANPVFAEFTDNLGTYPEILFRFGENIAPTEPAYSAMGYTFDEDGAYFIYHQQYRERETPPRSEIERVLEEEHDRAARAWSVDIQIDQPHVEIQLRIDDDEFARGGTDDVSPYVMWSVDDAGETVTVRLEAGDSIPVDRLSVEPEDALVAEFESGTVLEPGDEFAIDVSALSADQDDVMMRYNYADSEHDTILILDYTPDELDTE